MPVPASTVCTGTAVCYQSDSADEFLRDLKQFVQSLQGEKHRSTTYWGKMDKLWNDLQVRKQQLNDTFNDQQMRQLRKWEKKYRNLRKKQNRRT